MTNTVRRLPAVPTEPPFDDESGQPSTEGTLALALPLMDAPVPRDADADTAALARLLPVPPAAGIRTPGRVPARRRSETPPPGPRGVVFTRALLEVLAGRRPVRQLAGWASPDLLAELASSLPATPGRGRPAPVLTSLHVSQPRESAAEVCAVIRTRMGRRQAVALRMEHTPGRGWLVTRAAVI